MLGHFISIGARPGIQPLFIGHMVDTCYWVNDHLADANGRHFCRCDVEEHKYCPMIPDGSPHEIHNVRTQYPVSEGTAPMIGMEGEIEIRSSNTPHELNANIHKWWPLQRGGRFGFNVDLLGGLYETENLYTNIGWEQTIS